jgi:hypothetical protein
MGSDKPARRRYILLSCRSASRLYSLYVNKHFRYAICVTKSEQTPEISAMKHTILIICILAALPVLAAETVQVPVPSSDASKSAYQMPPPIVVPDHLPPLPPLPSPVTWEVWGFKWEGDHWVKQPAKCLKTTDLKQAIEFAKEVFCMAGWNERNNIPSQCIPQFSIDDPYSPSDGPADAPPAPVYTIWTYKVSDGKWEKDETFCRTANDWLSCTEYVNKINAIAGWRAATNCPESTLRPGQNKIDFGRVRGASGSGYSEGQYAIGGGYVHTYDGRIVYDPEFSPGGRTIYRPHMTIRIGRDATRNVHYNPPPNDP